jgi:DNA-binding response OmpR family regulator
MKLLLVVEDDPVAARMACGAVDKAGCFALPVTTVAGARAAVREWPVDGALVDLALPDGAGMDFVRFLREDAEGREMPILICTADSGRETVTEAIRAGASDFAVKPFDLRELSDRLRRLVASLPSRWDRWDQIRRRTELTPREHGEELEKLEEAVQTAAGEVRGTGEVDVLRGLLPEAMRLGHLGLVTLLRNAVENGVADPGATSEALRREARAIELFRTERVQGVGRVEWEPQPEPAAAG